MKCCKPGRTYPWLLLFVKPWNRCIWGHNFYHVSLFYFSWLIKFFLTIAFWKSLVPEAPQDFWCYNTCLPYIPRDCFKSYENFFPMSDFFPTSCIYLNPLLHQKVTLNVKNCILHTGLPTWQNFRFDISMHFLHSVLYAYSKMLTRRICLTNKSFLTSWLFHSFSWVLCLS